MAITSRALAFASRWFDPVMVASVFEPLVADWQREWLEAAPSRRRVVHARGLAAFICSVGISSFGLLRASTPRRVTVRVASRVAIFMEVAATILCLPVLARLGDGGSLSLFLASVASAAAYALPFAMVVGVDAIRCHEDLPPHVERGAALKLTAVSMVLMIPLSGGALGHVLLLPLMLWVRWRSLDLQHQPGYLRRIPIVPVILVAAVLLASDFGANAMTASPLPGGTLPLLTFAFSAVPEQWWSRRRRQETAS